MNTACNHCRILIADHRALVRAGMRALLERLPGAEVVGETGDGREAVERVRRDPPDVILLDPMLPGANGLVAVVRIRRLGVPTRVLMISMHDSPEYVGRAFAAGVSGYLKEDSGPDELRAALMALCAGRRYLCRSIDAGLVHQHEQLAGSRAAAGLHALTPRQRQVLRLIAEGQGTRRIAEHLSVGVKTVETHRAELKHRLGISDIPGLVRFAMRNGLLPPEAG